MLGVWWRAISLVLAVASVWFAQLGAHLLASTTSHILLGGLVASRFGLWLFDLAVSQMLQDWVPAEDIGKLPAKAVKSVCHPMLHVVSLEAAACIAPMQHACARPGIDPAQSFCLVPCQCFSGQCNPEQQPFGACHVECNACHRRLIFLSVLISCFCMSFTRATLHAIQAC